MAICSSQTYKDGMQVSVHTRVPYGHNGHRRHRRHRASSRLRPVHRTADTASKPPLPASRHCHFESKADWDGPKIVVPQTPDLLLSEEVSYLKQHQALLEDVWDAWEDPGAGPTSVTAPMTMAQLQQQMEARLLTREWIYDGVVAGSIAAVAVIGLCLW
jgi:hypothetical protein